MTDREVEVPEMIRSDFLPDQVESWVAVFRRYRGAIREEVERAGLSGDAAANKVGAIFMFFLMETVDQLPPDAPMGPHVRALARRLMQRVND
jgi:hypothetical protein